MHSARHSKKDQKMTTLTDNTPVTQDADESNADAALLETVQEAVWGENAPRGGRAVMNRFLKDGANVPLFFSQTLIKSLRDQGYASTTSAVCEFIDNSIQWGARNIRIYFNQRGGKGAWTVDSVILDDGPGMDPNVMKFAMSFGGSLNYDRREGIGRYGMGMKTAGLSMSPVVDVYSWQREGEFWNLTLDVEDIGRQRKNLIEMPEPQLSDSLPTDIAEILSEPMRFPKGDDQQLIADREDEVVLALGTSGTLIYLPECDRLDSTTAKPLVERSVKELGRIYRRFIDEGIRIYVNNRLVESFDPTYWSEKSRHTQIEDIGTTRSRLIASPEVRIPKSEGSEETAPVKVRLYRLPFEEWMKLPRKVLKNDLQVFSDQIVSVLRNDREMQCGHVPQIVGRHSTTNWLRIQIDFHGELDEAFGLSSNKQGVRPKPYVWELIKKEIEAEISRIRDDVNRFKARDLDEKRRQGNSQAERQAQEAESHQAKPLPAPAPTSPEEMAELELELRALAMMIKNADESDAEVLHRVRGSTYLSRQIHDPYWPFYHVETRAGKIVLTINTAHPFYEKVYKPIADAAVAGFGTDSEDEEQSAFDAAESVLTGLQLMLFSLARAQQTVSGSDDDRRELFDGLRKEWSEALATQLRVS
jgi:hypothetical protein